MALKLSKAAPARKSELSAPGKKVAEFAESADPEGSKALGVLALMPSANAAAVMSVHSRVLGVQETDIGGLAEALVDGMKDMWAGDMKRLDAMLYAQAHALQAIFTALSFRATKQEHMKNWEAYLRMALKAQNQCRMTLETLAMIKNPPTVFAKQANINSGGQQQINNGVAPAGGDVLARASQTESAPNELLENRDGERLDTRAESSRSAVDPKSEAVGKVNRPANR
jgi:hypothetical protein